MKLLHSSDWHIGRQFHQVSLLPDQEQVLAQIVEIAEREQVDAVLVAGDIYDRSVPPAAAVALLNKVLDRLCKDLDIPVVMIAGNHDSAERLGFGAAQLQRGGLHIVGPLKAEPHPLVLEDEHGPVAIYGIPYADPARVREVFDVEVSTHDQAMAVLCEAVDKQRRQQGFSRSIVLSHCFLNGGVVSESERPLSVGGAEQVSADHFAPFTYTALGHLHAPQSRGDSIRYSGSLLKYSFSEIGQRKSVTLVELDADGLRSATEIPLQPLRDVRQIEGMFADLIAAGPDDPNADDYLLIRLQDKGAILDAMSRLREVYPNALHLERPGLQSLGNGQQQPSRDRIRRGELGLFRDFYQQTQGETLSDAQGQLLDTLIDVLQKDSRGGAAS